MRHPQDWHIVQPLFQIHPKNMILCPATARVFPFSFTWERYVQVGIKVIYDPCKCRRLWPHVKPITFETDPLFTIERRQMHIEQAEGVFVADPDQFLRR